MSDYDPLALPAESFECLPHNLPTQPEPEPEPYVRIWQEHPSGKEVAMLLADDYRRVMHERDELRTENTRLRTALEGIAATDLSRDGNADLCYCRWFVGVAKQALEHAPAGGTRQ